MGGTLHFPSIFIVSRELAKLGDCYLHAYGAPNFGPSNEAIINQDSAPAATEALPGGLSEARRIKA